MQILFGRRTPAQPPPDGRPLICPYCGAGAALVRASPHPELGRCAELHSFECVDCGPWSEITVGLRH